MAEIEPCCDSDEEIFFGPVTEKERKIAENLRRREMINEGYWFPPSTQHQADTQGGEEGLHTLAMAAQMLTLSSSDGGDCPDDMNEFKARTSPQNEYCTVLPPVGTITRGIVMNANEGSHLELDAVKFLSRHLPEQNQSGFFQDSCEDSKSFYDSSNAHVNSMVSFLNNESDALNYLSPCSNSTDVNNFLKFENEEHDPVILPVSSGPHTANVEAVDPAEAKIPDVIPSIDHKYGILDAKVTCVDWDDANEISKGEFGIKLSDNEEDLEKVERNLKVEEILKFLADEDDKSEVKLLKEAMEKQSAVPMNGFPDVPSFNDTKTYIDSNDLLLNEICEDPCRRNGECESKDTPSVFSSVTVVTKVEISPEEIKTEEKVLERINEVTGCLEGNGLIGGKEVDEVVCGQSTVDLVKETITDMMESSSLVPNSETLDPSKRQNCGFPTPLGNIKKPPTGSTLKKPSSTHKRMPTPKVTPGMEKRPATPRPSRTPASGTDAGKLQRTPGPLRPLQSPATDSMSNKNCARSLLQEPTPHQTGTPFKTPNTKVKSSVGSKIPHLSSFSPSLNKSKKFAGIVSPVSQYIHSKPVILIVNKKPDAGPSSSTQTRNMDLENKSPKASESATLKLQSLPAMLGERGAENVDVSNYSALPEVNFKSALPVKILSPNEGPKTPKSGKTAIVSKHLGHITIPSTACGKATLPFECRESMVPEGEVSLLLSKEVELHCPTLLRN